MNFAGKFESNGFGSHASEHVHVDLLSHHHLSGAITIPDAHLLFAGDYARSGNDLIVSDRDHRVVVPDYFHGGKRPALVSPEGVPLDPKVIEALTGHVEYAQAAGTASAAKLIGHVVKTTGSASVVRNGVTVELNNGDNVYQSDVVQTGSGSSLGLVLIDGTTFNMTANARLMLSELNYDPNSTSNSSLFTLVEGATSFVAGQVAKTGDMKVGTPVATLGIRGTAVILDVSAISGQVSVSVVDQQDGIVHAVEVFDFSGKPDWAGHEHWRDADADADGDLRTHRYTNRQDACPGCAGIFHVPADPEHLRHRQATGSEYAAAYRRQAR